MIRINRGISSVKAVDVGKRERSIGGIQVLRPLATSSFAMRVW